MAKHTQGSGARAVTFLRALFEHEAEKVVVLLHDPYFRLTRRFSQNKGASLRRLLRLIKSQEVLVFPYENSRTFGFSLGGFAYG